MVAGLALAGVLITALVAVGNARKRNALDERLLLLKTKLEGDVTRLEQLHAEQLARLEHALTCEAEERARVRKADATRLKVLLEELDPAGLVAFLRDHDFGSSFVGERIMPLFRFADGSVDPHRDFLDARLQVLYQALVDSSRQLSNGLALKTAPKTATLHEVIPVGEFGERPKLAWEHAKQLNELATQFVEAFDRLVRAARAMTDG